MKIIPFCVTPTGFKSQNTGQALQPTDLLDYAANNSIKKGMKTIPFCVTPTGFKPVTF